ncbi:MAG: right-handed parallel beta-helix repeat-containing protein [Acidobacteria bacterium]|nr:right-handed parallel beta-helix repeat-containing protein [Acidobacteriota bacterium]
MFRNLAAWTAVCILIGLVAPALASEGRMPIYAWPTVISNPGQYVVTRNLNASGSGTSVIIVQASDVDIDLNGFVLETDGAPVIQAANVSNLAIRNGTIKRGVRGIAVMSQIAEIFHKVVVERVNVIETMGEGIFIHQVSDFAIRWCNILNTEREGIWVDGVGPAPTVVQGTIEHNRLESTGGVTVRWGSSVGILNNRLEVTNVVAPPPSMGAIVYDYSHAGLIASNTIQVVNSGSGIFLGDANGNKVYNNVVREARMNGIHLAGMSDDNLVLENVVSGCGDDGIRVDGSRNHVDRNVTNSNCRNGTGQCWGLHFSMAWGGMDNTFGRNTARGNAGMPPACLLGPSPYVPTPDFCDEQPGTGSFNDNYMPNFF